MDIFNINIEFDHSSVRDAIKKCVEENGKGYVCVVDANVLTMAQRNETYRQIIRNAYINICDGSSIAAMCNHIYGTSYTDFTGPHIFAEYIEQSKYRQLLLGNTNERYYQIKNQLESKGKTSDHLSYIPVPFASIDEFDFESIGKQVKDLNPDFVWVSLGAPKQEIFCSRLLTHIDRGLLFGIGAAFSFYIGENKDAAFSIGSLRMNWLGRVFKEPQKQLKRLWGIVCSYPSIYKAEIQLKKSKNSNKKP